MNKYYLQMFAVVFAAFALFVGMTLPAHAEDYIEPPAEDIPVTEPVEDVAEPTPAPVPVTINPDDLAQALAQAMATSEPDPDATEEPPAEPAADYNERLSNIETTLSIIAENTQPATPETAFSAFEKPFDDYSPVEVIMCIGLVVLLAYVVIKIIMGV